MVLSSFEQETCPFRPSERARMASTKSTSLIALALVEAAHFLGGQFLALSRAKLAAMRNGEPFGRLANHAIKEVCGCSSDG